MPTIKPDDLIVKSLTAFVKDVGNQFQYRPKDMRLDTAYLLRRFANEGISFVSKTLPELGKAVTLALDSGTLSMPTSFKRKRPGVLPLLFNGLFSMVFNTDGTLLDQPDADAIRLLRQIGYLFYKVEGEYPKSLVEEKVAEFVTTDASLNSCETINVTQMAYLNLASDVITSCFSDFDPRDIIPRPGPGVTANRRHHSDRFRPDVLYKDIHNVYPYYEYFYGSTKCLLDNAKEYRSLKRQKAGVSRLALVPKDSRGPRIICMEPHEYMHVQQGLARRMMSHIEEHPMTRGRVNFSDQAINGELAMQASLTQTWATLDMKEASDRISANLVELLFDGVPRLRDALLALSTPDIELPGGILLRKKKFAPMGSALCFPVMSMVHFALAVSTAMVDTGLTLPRALRSCYVYGDDLIVTSNVVPALLKSFPLFDLKFNEQKSFWGGHFRESCGIDAYAGVDVTPMKVKKLAFNRKSASGLSTHLAYFHNLFKRGLWEMARVWQNYIEQTWGKLPRVTQRSSILGYIVPSEWVRQANRGRWKWNSKLQCISMRCKTSCARPSASMLGGWDQWLRSQLICFEDSTRLTERRDLPFTWGEFPISNV